MKNERLMSLDVLRGADMLCIMGLSGAIMAFCSWIGMKDCWLATQMTHVDWHGFRQHDTIFPLFLFLAGVSWPFSYASQVAKGTFDGRHSEEDRLSGFRALCAGHGFGGTLQVGRRVVPL